VIGALVAAGAAGVATIGRGQTSTATAKTTIPLQAVPVVTRDLATYTSASGTLGYGAAVTILEGGATGSSSSASSASSSPAATGSTGSTGSNGATVGGAAPSASSSGSTAATSSSAATTGTTSSNTVTRLVAEGATVDRGGELYAIDNQPRVLFFGTTPAWRDLSALSTPAVDVFELEQNLVALGYDPDGAITIDETFDDATTLAVQRWQKDHGYDQTGVVSFGQVVFLDGSVRVGTHHAEVGTIARSGAAVTEVTVLSTVATAFAPAGGMVEAVRAAGTAVVAGTPLFSVDAHPIAALVGSTPIARTLELGVADGEDVRVLEQNLVAMGDDPQKAIVVNTTFDAATADAVNRFKAKLGTEQDGVLPLGAVVVLPEGLSIGTHRVESGAAVRRNAPVLDVVVSHRQVTTTIAVTDRGSMKPGDEVQLVFPDQSTKVGRVSSIGSVASKDARNANATPTVPVVITMPESDIDPNLVSTPVTVNIVKDKAAGVLAVPTGALVALKEGGFAVQVADAAGSHLVGVKPGLYADSYVQISGDGISADTKVMVPA
jgi:peptidoglycan hydrolase-like protein with peptidoglycan-binding domain